MKILHTADWHLGRALYGRKRYEEFGKFLDWLVGVIEEEGVDALLVAGDVFDTSTPSNRAQELYYRFLCRVAASCCRHVVVIGGEPRFAVVFECAAGIVEGAECACGWGNGRETGG